MKKGRGDGGPRPPGQPSESLGATGLLDDSARAGKGLHGIRHPPLATTIRKPEAGHLEYTSRFGGVCWGGPGRWAWGVVRIKS